MRSSVLPATTLRDSAAWATPVSHVPGPALLRRMPGALRRLDGLPRHVLASVIRINYMSFIEAVNRGAAIKLAAADPAAARARKSPPGPVPARQARATTDTRRPLGMTSTVEWMNGRITDAARAGRHRPDRRAEAAPSGHHHRGQDRQLRARAWATTTRCGGIGEYAEGTRWRRHVRAADEHLRRRPAADPASARSAVTPRRSCPACSACGSATGGSSTGTRAWASGSPARPRCTRCGKTRSRSAGPFLAGR